MKFEINEENLKSVHLLHKFTASMDDLYLIWIKLRVEPSGKSDMFFIAILTNHSPFGYFQVFF